MELYCHDNSFLYVETFIVLMLMLMEIIMTIHFLYVVVLMLIIKIFPALSLLL